MYMVNNQNILPSKFNIFSKIRNSENFFLVNILHESADLLTNTEAEQYLKLTKGEPVDPLFLELMAEKKYVINPIEENRAYRQAYLNFLDNRETDEIQIFFVPNYTCNFACSYCYQSNYATDGTNPEYKQIIDSFFHYINTKFAGRRKYLTLFGGEPLLNTIQQRNLIEYFLTKANDNELEISIVTNGYWLDEYLPILKNSKIREIQVTLDGTSEVHNNRRFLKGKQPTFDKIVNGIDHSLDQKIKINLRIVVDKENIENLPLLASFAAEKGWTHSPYFKTQIGRNYELHYCQSAPQKLFTRIELYEKLYELIQKYPSILDFHRPAFSITKFLWENNNLPEALFDACPACKTEWAFDYTGKIYPCTATVGKSGEELGTFYPYIEINEEKIKEWESRDVTTIDKCKNCNVQLACGGGCAAVAKNKFGKTSDADCRPIIPLLELGFSLYFNEAVNN